MSLSSLQALALCGVPNAPCGVESCGFLLSDKKSPPFLMHRVELKAFERKRRYSSGLAVPNAPCGVESKRLDEMQS